MFLKGIKRKFSDHGEELVSSGDQGPASLSAQSRTLLSSYSLQRHSLHDMSLIKLQLCHMLVEPNLSRSMLIAKTVWQIQEEITQDGTWQMMTQALAAAQCPADHLVATEVLCRQTDAATQVGQSPKPVSVVGLEEGYHSEEVVMESDVETEAIMSTLSPASPQLSSASYMAAPFGMGPCCEEEEEDCDCEEDEEEDSEECVSEGDEGDEDQLSSDSKTGDTVFGPFEIKLPVPPPDTGLDELFSDVDPSYYDLDTMLTGTPKMGPYDLPQSLSSHGSTALSSSWSCRSDLNELDHIMEIIVGS